MRRGVLARGRRENCGQDYIWAIKYSSHACQSRVSTASPGSSLHPGSALKCTSPGLPAREASERRGQRKLKERKNTLAHLGFPVLLGPSFLICFSRTAFDGRILMFQVGFLGSSAEFPLLPRRSKKPSQELQSPSTSLFHELLQLPSLRTLDSAN